MEIAAESFESLQLGAQRRIQKGAKGLESRSDFKLLIS